MSEVVEALVAELETGAELVAAGTFTLDIAAAREKLESYRLADPNTFLLLVVEAAHLLPGCSAVDFEIGPKLTRIILRGVVLDEAELRGVLESSRTPLTGLDPAAEARLRGRQLLTLALISVTQLDDVHAVLGSSGAQTRALLDSGTELRFAPRGPVEAVDATWLRVVDRGHAKMPGTAGMTVWAHRRELVRGRCRYATIPVSLDGRAISTGFSLPEVERSYVVRGDDGGLIALIGRSAARADATLLLIVNGVLLEKLIDHELGAHFVGLIHASDLPRDLSMTRLLRGAAFEQTIAAVRRAAATLPADNWAPAVYVEQGDLARMRAFTGTIIGAITGLQSLWLILTWGRSDPMQLVAALVLALVAGLCSVPVTRHVRDLRIRQRGHRALATIERVLGTVAGRARVELMIHAPGEAPYRQETRWLVDVDQPLEQGDRVHVVIDPEDPTRIVVGRRAIAASASQKALPPADH